MKVVAMSGSMKFQKEMPKIAKRLEAKYGYCVLQLVYDFENEGFSEEEYKKVEEAHLKKIDLCDALYVVDVGGYIGVSTGKEIEYAKKLGKEILYFSDESGEI